MGYGSMSIAAAIKALNDQYFLPAIQREFVWEPEKIILLFDSLMRGYPISSFLFWQLEERNRDNWEVYRFIENAKEGTHNELANTDGVRQMMLVLDGQQRLSSLLVGLKGTYTIKIKYRKWNDPKAWIKKRLYLNLLKNPQSVVEEDRGAEEGIYYEFSFMDNPPESDTNCYWFKVGRILDFHSEDVFYRFLDDEEEKLPDDVTKKQIQVFRRNLERLYRAVWKDEVVAFYTEMNQDYDRVLDIFVRANEGGKKLSKSDLLLSMITSNWVGINAREEISGFVDRINKELTGKNNFNKDFIMKTCLVVADLPVAYKVQNFNNQNLQKIRDRWDDIKSAIERVVDLVNYFGIDRDNLTSANALIPLVYYLSHRPKLTLRGSTPFDVRNSSLVRKWVGVALLNGVFGGSSDNILRDCRIVLQRLKRAEANFPVGGINQTVERSGRKASFDQYAMEDVLSLKYNERHTFLALTLFYEENGWGTMTYHVDHIFPQSMFEPSKLRDAGFAQEQIDRYRSELMNRLGNLQLLLARENQEKLDKPFNRWISTRDEGFKARHLIPDDPTLWTLERFDDFIKAREKLIATRLRQLFGTIEGA